MSAEATTATAAQHRSCPSRDSAVESLRMWIRSGRLLPGAPLPSERDLAKRLSVARGTVRAALKELESGGLIENGPGRVRCVAARLPEGDGPAASVDASRHIFQGAVAVVSVIPPTTNHHIARTAEQRQIHDNLIHFLDQKALAPLLLNPDRFAREGMQTLVDMHPAGLMLIYDPSDDMETVAALRVMQEAGIPVIVHGNRACHRFCDRVYHDHAAGQYEITKWLIDRGCRRILRLWRAGEECWWMPLRNAGYERAMAEAELEALPSVTTICESKENHDRATFDNEVRAIAGFLPEYVANGGKVDAIVTSTDGHARQIAAALRLYGIEPNRDILLAGYDNTWWEQPEDNYEPVRPAVTLEKRNDLTARALVDLLTERIEGNVPDAAQERRVPGELIVRDEKGEGR